jgi:hypothetical protein
MSLTLSFTSGGLLYTECLIVAAVYDTCLDWKQTIETAATQNLLQARTASSGKRVLREVTSRLRLLTPVQLRLLCEGSRTEQNLVLWLAACKRYRILHLFGSEVLRQKYLQLDLTLEVSEFERFLDSQSLWHPEIEELTDSTRAKLRQVTFRMLREAEILSKEDVIQPVLLSPELVDAVRSDSTSHFTVFPVSEADVQGASL